MKRIIALVSLLAFIASPCSAGSVQDKLKAVVKAKSGTTSTTWEYPSGIDSFTLTDNPTSAVVFLADTITLSARTYTKLGVNITTVGATTECWISLYDSEGTRLAYDSFTPSEGWNEGDISYSASATTYSIIVQCNHADWRVAANATSCTDKYGVNSPYTTTPPASVSLSGWAAANCFGMRIGY